MFINYNKTNMFLLTSIIKFYFNGVEHKISRDIDIFLFIYFYHDKYIILEIILFFFSEIIDYKIMLFYFFL